MVLKCLVKEYLTNNKNKTGTILQVQKGWAILFYNSARSPLLRASGLQEETMKKLHIAISTDKIEETVADYTIRLGIKPCSYIGNEYALWRTDFLNVSIRQDSSCRPGELRHLGWEDPSAQEFSQDTDVNGIVWEYFNAHQQAEEINNLWPEANYCPKD
jgi:hypothetical protein